MKSSKGKVPVGGKAKRVTVVPHGARKQKEKDPVEVRTINQPPCFLLASEFSRPLVLLSTRYSAECDL